MLDCDVIDDGFKNFARKTAEHLGLLLQRLCQPEFRCKIIPKTRFRRIYVTICVKINLEAGYNFTNCAKPLKY